MERFWQVVADIVDQTDGWPWDVAGASRVEFVLTKPEFEDLADGLATYRMIASPPGRDEVEVVTLNGSVFDMLNTIADLEERDR